MGTELRMSWLIEMLDRLLDPRTEHGTRMEVSDGLESVLAAKPVELLGGLSELGAGTAGSAGSGMKVRNRKEIQLQSLVLLRSLALKPLSRPFLSGSHSHSQAQSQSYAQSYSQLDQHQHQHQPWSWLSPVDQQRILNQLLDALISSSDAVPDQTLDGDLSTQLSHSFSQLAKHSPQFIIQSDHSLLNNLLHSTNKPILQTAILNIFAIVPSIFSNDPANIHSIILSSLQSNHFPLRLAALHAICLPSLEPHPAYVDALLTSLLQPLTHHHNQPDIEAALNRLIEFLAFNHIHNLPAWLEPLLELSLNRSRSSTVRALAIEALVSLLEGSPPPPDSPRLPWLEPVFGGLLSLMAELDHHHLWSSTLDDSDDDPDALYIQAEQALDRLTQELANTHSDQLFELLLAAIQQSPPPIWQARHALLSAMAVMGQGLAESYQLSSEPIFHALNAGFEDPHPRVIYAAIYAVSQLSSTLKDTFLAPPAHHQVLSWLVRCLEMDAQPRLQAFASKALINVLWDGIGDRRSLIADQMVSLILSRLIALCESAPHGEGRSDKVRLDAVNAIGRLFGSVSQKAALACYDVAMKTFERLIDQVAMARQALANGATDVEEDDVDETELRVYEAVGQLAVASGQQRFDGDSSRWASLIVRAIRTRPKDLARMLGALTRLSGGMTAERFIHEGYLDVVLGPLLDMCQSKPDISVSALVDDEHEFDDPQWESVVIGEQTFGIKAVELCEKEQSIESLVVLAEQLGAWLVPHCDRIVQSVVPLLKFYFSDAVRESAMVLLPVLLRSAKSSGMTSAQLEAISTSFCQSITLALSVEPMDRGNLAASLMTAWADCIRYQAPSGSEVDRMAEECERRLVRAIEQREEEEEEEESLMRMLTSMSRVLRLAIGLRPDWGWRRLMDRVVEWLGSCGDAQAGIALGLKRMGFRLVGAFVKSHGGGGGEELIAKVGLRVLDGFKDKDDCVRGLAPFIVGLCAEKNGSEYKPVYMELIKSSVEELVRGLKRGEDESSGLNVEAIQVARENCVSALAKIIRNPEGLVIEVEKILPEWIEALPIEIDVEEVEPSYGLLLELIARGHESVDPTKNNITRIKQVIRSLFSAISNESVGVESRNSLSVGLGAYLREIPGEVLERLSVEEEEAGVNGGKWEGVWKEVERRRAAAAAGGGGNGFI